MNKGTRVAAPNDSDKDDSQTVLQPAGSHAKEVEPARAEEAKIVAEIKSVSEALDAEALDKIREHLPEAESRSEKPYIPANVSKAGVKHIEAEAEEVIRQGTTITLPIDEEAYARGQKEKGVSSLVALTLWIGRILKLAHKRAWKVVFR